ncbi:MAG: sodium:proline symporter, partial [Acinetobacter sp.]
AVTVILWKNTMADTSLYEIVPGFILSFISIVVVSLMGKAPQQDVVDRFEKAEQIYDREMN